MRNGMKLKRFTTCFLAFIILLLLNYNSNNIFAAEVSGLQNNKVYRLRNAATGKYLYTSGSADWSNIYMYDNQSGNTAYQDFKLVYNSGSDTYTFYPVRASSGKVMDIATSVNNNVHVYSRASQYNYLQQWKITHISGGKYKIYLPDYNGYALTCNSGNGSSTKTGQSDTGNVYVKAYQGDTNKYQQWYFEEVSPVQLTSTISSGNVYHIRNKLSGKYLDIKANGTADGTKLQQYDFGDYPSERWKITYVSNGYYRFESMLATGKCLDAAEAERYSQAQIMTKSTNSSQLWKIIPNGDGSFRLSPKKNEFSMCLAISGASMNNNANAIMHEFGYSENDCWIFELVNHTADHRGDILIGATSSNYDEILCAYEGRGSVRAADKFVQQITATNSKNTVRTLFNRKNEFSTKYDLLSKSLNNLSGNNVDDVDLMFFSGHHSVENGFHFTHIPISDNDPIWPVYKMHFTCLDPLAKFTQSEARFGYTNGARTKWVVAYTCNFLTGSMNTISNMLSGNMHTILGYRDSQAYIVDLHMEAYGAALNRGENIIDSYMRLGLHYNSNYHKDSSKLAAIYLDIARSDTIYRYVPDNYISQGKKVLYEYVVKGKS